MESYSSMFPEDECWEELLIEIEDWYSTKWRHTPRAVHSEVFLGLGFAHGRIHQLAGDPDTRICLASSDCLGSPMFIILYQLQVRLLLDGVISGLHHADKFFCGQ